MSKFYNSVLRHTFHPPAHTPGPSVEFMYVCDLLTLCCHYHNYVYNIFEGIFDHYLNTGESVTRHVTRFVIKHSDGCIAWLAE